MTKLVGILGANYCGSTVMDMVMNTHPDMVGVGELNLVTEGSFNPKNAVSKIGCEICHYSGNTCPILPKEGFPYQMATVHREIAERAGVDWVVDSSKAARIYRKYEKAKSADGYWYFVLIKTPEAAAASYVKHYTPPHPEWAPDFKGSPTGDEIAKTWCNHYKQILDFVKGRQHIVIKYEEFAEDPKSTLTRVSEFLGVQDAFDISGYGDVKYGHHRIAGNYAAKTSRKPVQRLNWEHHRADMSSKAWGQMREMYRRVTDG